jgi:hypothetical protein
MRRVGVRTSTYVRVGLASLILRVVAATACADAHPGRRTTWARAADLHTVCRWSIGRSRGASSTPREGLLGWRELPISKRELGRDFGAWFGQDASTGCRSRCAVEATMWLEPGSATADW